MEEKNYSANRPVSEWVTRCHPQKLAHTVSGSLVREMGSLQCLIYYSEPLNFSSYLSRPESVKHTDGFWLAKSV